MATAIESGVSFHSTHRLTVSDTLEAPEWDAFLSKTPDTSHVQSSLWGRLKAESGWQVRRITVDDGKAIVGGAQLLFRRVRSLIRIGYVSKGPVLSVDAPGLYRALLGEVLRVATAEGVRYFIVQPAARDSDADTDLRAAGFELSAINVGPTATVLLDLQPSEEALFAAMRTSSRRNIRAAERNGIVVREGSQEDLPVFHRLLSQTGQRQGFTPEPLDYYQSMWRIFEPAGHLRIFVSEHQGVPLAALIALPFGDTVVYKRAGWSGENGNLRPNEVMSWSAIRWAKAHGYRYYDLEGITPRVADAHNAGTAFQDEDSDTYKLKFGGEVVYLPAAYDCFPGRKVATLSRQIATAVQRQPLFHRFAQSLRAT